MSGLAHATAWAARDAALQAACGLAKTDDPPAAVTAPLVPALIPAARHTALWATVSAEDDGALRDVRRSVLWEVVALGLTPTAAGVAAVAAWLVGAGVSSLGEFSGQQAAAGASAAEWAGLAPPGLVVSADQRVRAMLRPVSLASLPSLQALLSRFGLDALPAAFRPDQHCLAQMRRKQERHRVGLPLLEVAAWPWVPGPDAGWRVASDAPPPTPVEDTQLLVARSQPPRTYDVDVATYAAALLRVLGAAALLGKLGDAPGGPLLGYYGALLALALCEEASVVRRYDRLVRTELAAAGVSPATTEAFALLGPVSEALLARCRAEETRALLSRPASAAQPTDAAAVPPPSAHLTRRQLAQQRSAAAAAARAEAAAAAGPKPLPPLPTTPPPTRTNPPGPGGKRPLPPLPLPDAKRPWTPGRR
eukprot:TRINITY_DN6484_c0_g2_i1.p2 TRINITY_DN6484_c0_g2~~TRINITY_DN6484_c0_g2_i1.p2  ORF type:complete len:436 (+),score=98.68 TRINITY_DN6484_c0_g2_i1:47-1309(+)